jgi:hypothetical protein
MAADQVEQRENGRSGHQGSGSAIRVDKPTERILPHSAIRASIFLNFAYSRCHNSASYFAGDVQRELFRLPEKIEVVIRTALRLRP